MTRNECRQLGCYAAWMVLAGGAIVGWGCGAAGARQTNENPSVSNVDGGSRDAATSRASADAQYLSIQIFTPLEQYDTSKDKKDIAATVEDILTTLDRQTGTESRRLAFAIGPITLNYTDDQLRAIIRDAAELAEKNDIAFALHLDDSMFWNRHGGLASNPDNVEWTDWNRTPAPARRWGGGDVVLGGSQLCYESLEVRAEVSRRGKEVIGAEVATVVSHLKTLGKEHLFAGIMVGWEMRIDPLDPTDSKPIGFCSLSHRGFGPSNPPAN
jgi:hypothetical protein